MVSLKFYSIFYQNLGCMLFNSKDAPGCPAFRSMDIYPSSFFPKPKVMSSLLIFEPKNNYIKFKNSQNLEYITNIFFNQKRKMIKKPLNILFKDSKRVVDELDLDINLRPQNLKKDTFYKICLIYEKLIK